MAMLFSFTNTGARIAYKVRYEGKIIATVGSKQQFTDALSKVVDLVDGSLEDVEQVVSQPSFDPAITLNTDIDSDEAVAVAIIENTDEIVSAASLYVNGEFVAIVQEQELNTYINNHLNSFNVEGVSCVSSFSESVEIKQGYYMLSEVEEISAVYDAVNSLTVITNAQQVRDVVVPYKSSVQKTNEKVIGYRAVATKGVAGVNRITEDVVFVNGAEQSRTAVDTQLITAPVNEVVVVGTARSAATAAQKQAAHSAGFVFPLPSGTWQVSAYYGDGRGHKGMDLRAPKGTSIMAVASGRVIQSGWDGGYGYCVTIEHSNGIRTKYAHASALCCNVGDYVSAGEVIALVGTTGNSTGNHLHFEVIVGGSRLDPAPYIGLD